MAHKALFTSISAGKHKGKKLLLPSLDSTRSTKSITKESLFDTLQSNIIDEIFVEVFGGSGSMGLEAISRGAKEAYFIEKNRAAFLILEKNCNTISPSQAHCLLGDSFNELPKLIEKLTQKAYFYFDPPFSIREGMDNIYLQVIELIQNIPPSKVHMIVIEHMSALILP
ncbi:MAG: RsmD family RNA methyltransferase, partial [Sulfurospirillaceae bacterium]|nr:RsmD family RNA methyltransferase [Sulfurospirillaceae bacterium]